MSDLEASLCLDDPMTDHSSPVNSPLPAAVGDGGYAPSPNTRSLAVNRASQLRVQTLLRQLLTGEDIHRRVDTVRVLRKTLREVQFKMAWLTQVDLLETLERVLRQELECNGIRSGSSNSSNDWRLVNDCTQLLIEAIPKLEHEFDTQTVERSG